MPTEHFLLSDTSSYRVGGHVVDVLTRPMLSQLPSKAQFKDAKISENLLNPVMLIFIGKLSLAEYPCARVSRLDTFARLNTGSAFFCRLGASLVCSMIPMLD